MLDEEKEKKEKLEELINLANTSEEELEKINFRDKQKVYKPRIDYVKRLGIHQKEHIGGIINGRQ